MIGVAVQDYLRSGRTAVWEPIFWDGTSVIVIAGLFVLPRKIMRDSDRFLAQPVQWAIVQLYWLPLLCGGFVCVEFGIRHAFYALLGLEYRHEGWGNVFLYESTKITLFYCGYVTVLFGALSFRALASEKERAERSVALLRRAQLQNLTQQVQPHFLFNALNTISSLMYADVARADSMLSKLAEILSAAVDLGREPENSLGREMELLRSYADLMEERFSDRVEIAWQVDERLFGCKVPAFGMQPMLENVFKHTVERKNCRVRITISVRRESETLVLAVEDDAGRLARGPDAVTDGGVGTSNLRERLAARYGEQACFELTQLAPAGVRSEIRLPCVS